VGLTARRDVLLSDVAADYAHWVRAVRFPGGGCAERCDCGGRCAVVRETVRQSVRRAALALERKGVLRVRWDPFGRKRVSLVSWPVRWEFHPDDGRGPHLCPSCGLRSAGRAVRGEAA
jgi:hypothetical protein